MFGILERNSKNICLEAVPQSNDKNLFDVLLSRVLTVFKIYSDPWRGNNLISKNYECLKVNHHLCFVDPGSPEIHTNNIES